MRGAVGVIVSLLEHRRRARLDDDNVRRYDAAKRVAVDILRQLEQVSEETVMDALAIALGATLAEFPDLEEHFIGVVRAAAADLRRKV